MSARPLFTTCAIWLVALSGSSRAAMAQTFVYDTRTMTGNGSWANSRDAAIGVQAEGSGNHDDQTAEDFTLANRTRLTRVSVDMLGAVAGGGTPSGGFLVEVFANIAGNHPAETPTFSMLVPPSSVTMDGSFNNSLTQSQSGDRITWGMSLAAGSIVLDPGTWWISVTAKNDGDPFGGRYSWAGNKIITGLAGAHRRCGGLDHANNYPCLNDALNTRPDWDAITSNAEASNVSMRIEGAIEIGVCCAVDNSCTLAAQADCMGGSTWTAGGSCLPNPCPSGPTLGSCCAFDMTCALTTQENCLNVTWTSGASCSPNICAPTPIGACCTGPNGACTTVTYANCGGVIWIGGGSCEPTPCPSILEVEPNDVKADATPVTLASGIGFSGTCVSNTSSPGVSSRDYFRIRTTAQALGIYRHTLTPTMTVYSPPSSAGQVNFQVRGLNQTAGTGAGGVIGTTETLLLNAAVGAPISYYGFGRQEQFSVMLGAQESSAGAYYTCTLTSAPVTPIALSGTVRTGAVTLSLSSTSGNPDMWLYDSNLNPIVGAGNQGGATAAGPMTRTLAPGTYYLAVGVTNLANNLASPADDTVRINNVLEFPDALFSSGNTATGNFTLTVADTDAGTTNIVQGFSVGSASLPSEVKFLQFTVVGSDGACCATSGACTVLTQVACMGGSVWTLGGVCDPNPCPQPASGACCAGTSCSIVAGAGACVGTYKGNNSTCDFPANPVTCCPANFNHTGGLDVADIFAFLTAWFASTPSADFNGVDGVTVSDIFAFLSAWFAGC